MLKRMMPVLAGGLALLLGVPASSETVLETSQVLAATPEAADQLPPTYGFVLSDADDYVVTLRDLNNPAPLESLQALVIRDLQVAAELEFDYPTPPDTTLVPKAQTFIAPAGNYRVHVLGKIPAGGAGGMFDISVAPAGGGTAVLTESDGIATQDGPAPGQSVLQTSFTIANAGTYQLTLTDRQFPAALAGTDIGLLRVTGPGSPALALQTLTGQGTFSAPYAGDTYELIIIATADSNLGSAGLYGVTITGGPSNSVIYRSDNAVGQLPPAKTVNVSTAGTYALTLTDLTFPEALTSFAAAVIQNNTFVGSVTNAGSNNNLPLLAGSAQLFIHTNTATTGALSVRLAQGAQVAYADVHMADASPDAPTPAIYSFAPSQPVAAGNYTLTLADLRFPSQLASIDVAVVQGTSLVYLADAAVTDSVALQAGPVRVLVAVTPPPGVGTTPGNGMFGLTLTTQPGNAMVVESTQGVGGLFTSMPVNLPAAGRYDVTLKDFEFPERLRTSWLAITRGTTLAGQVIGSSSIQNLQFDAGTYVLNFLGQPAQNASYGTFGLKVADSTPAPVVTLTASPAAVTSGQTSSLTWSATNATSCTASGGWSGTKTASATPTSQPTAALTANTTFELECVGPGGRSTASATVTVNAPSPRGGGGGSMDPLLLISVLAMLAVSKARGRRRPAMS